MYPTFPNPRTAVTLAAMMSDEAIARARRRNLVARVRNSRDDAGRRPGRR